LRFAQLLEQLEQRLEQPQLARGVAAGGRRRAAVAESRGQRGQPRAAGGAERPGRRGLLAGPRAPGAPPGGGGERAPAPVHAPPAEKEHLVPCDAALELGHQPALAYAGVAADQDERGPAGARLAERELKLGELAGATDEAAAGEPRPHGRSIAATPGWL